MTLLDLKRMMQSHQSTSQQSEMLQRVRDKPFWIWDSAHHRDKDKTWKGDCCFTDIIGRPRKNGNGSRRPFWDYQKMLYWGLFKPGYLNSGAGNTTKAKEANVLYPFKEKHLWVKKATGLGVTELMLRIMAWLCVRNDDCKNSQMVIVTGPNIDLAIKLIRRMKKLFQDKLDISFSNKETVLELNGCEISAYPSNHIDSFRSLTNPKFLFLDELDFIPKFQQDEVLSVSERYIGKSDPFIVLCSTPNAPNGLFQHIEHQDFNTCIYKKLFLDYTYGLDKIYTKAEIEKAKQSPSFPREYELQYLGLIGNVFSQLSIDNATKIQYNPENINVNAKMVISLDPGFGSSKFAIVITQYVDGKIQVIHSEEYDRPNFAEMISKVWHLKQLCGYISNVYVDASAPAIVEALKKEFEERYDIQHIRDQFAYCRKYNLQIEDRMIVVPVPFSVEGAKMLQHAKWLMEETEEDGSSLIAIHPRFDKLLIALRTAVANENRLDKEATAHNDILDAFRMNLQFYRRSKE